MYPPPAYIFIYIFVMKPAVSPSSLYIYLLYLLWSRLENLYSTAGIKEQARSYIYIYTLIVWGLFVSFFVCLCLINVKTAEPIGPKFCTSETLWMIWALFSSRFIYHNYNIFCVIEFPVKYNCALTYYNFYSYIIMLY